MKNICSFLLVVGASVFAAACSAPVVDGAESSEGLAPSASSLHAAAVYGPSQCRGGSYTCVGTQTTYTSCTACLSRCDSGCNAVGASPVYSVNPSPINPSPIFDPPGTGTSPIYGGGAMNGGSLVPPGIDCSLLFFTAKEIADCEARHFQ